MPITAINGQANYTVTPLSNSWTHQEVASEAMVLTNTIDNENIQLSNVRTHIKSAISYLANLLNMAASPFYGINMTAEIESTAHPSGLPFINLATPLGTVIPVGIINEVKRVNSTKISLSNNAAYSGNFTGWDVSMLTQQNNFFNLQHRDTVAWTHHGNDLLLFAGSNIQTPISPAGSECPYSLLPADVRIVLMCFRQPILDDMLPTNNANSIYFNNVDLPDRYIHLLLQMVQKMILQQINVTPPAQLEQDINQGLMQINSNLNQDLQFERAEREKLKYGSPVRGMP